MRTGFIFFTLKNYNLIETEQLIETAKKSVETAKI